MSLATFLSEYVHHIIVEYSKTCENGPRKYLTNDLTYDWDEIEHVLGEIPEDFNIVDQSESWCLEKAHLVWSVIHQAGSAVEVASDHEKAALSQLCEWTDYQPDMFEFPILGKLEDEGEILLAVLLMTSALERSLGNVYLTKNRPVPFLLRDLLKTPELSIIFGKVPVVFTQLLVGCPRALNLRNITWHGFVSPMELHPYLVSALAVLFASLGKLLPDRQIVPKRPQFSSFENFQGELDHIFPDIILTSRCDEIQDLIKTSSIIPEKFKVFWKKVYHLFQSERYGDSLVLLMPQLEHCLRVVYCKVNDCPARLLTAESTAFYTTLDEILARPEGGQVVRDGALMMLLDITSSLTGPRLRDRLSHGEIQLASVPRWLVNFVFCLALAIAHNFCNDNSSKDITCCNITLCSQLQETTSHYRSKFHIVATLRRQLVSLLDHCPSWQNCFPPADADVQTASCQRISALDKLMFPHMNNVAEKLNAVKECVDNCELLTLYRPRMELELAAALCGVLNGVAQTAEKVCEAATSRHQLWCNRSLRSRARATALRMWTVLPDVWLALLCVVMITTLCYKRLPHLVPHGKLVHRLVKAMTKTVENTVTMCDVYKNRWTEAHQILSDMAAMCLGWFNENPGLINKTV